MTGFSKHLFLLLLQRRTGACQEFGGSVTTEVTHCALALITCRYYSIQLFLDRTAPYLSGGRAFGRTSGRTSGRRPCRQREKKKKRGGSGGRQPPG